MFSRLLGWYTIYVYISWGLLPLTEFCQVQNSLCVQVLCSHILAALAALLHSARAVGVSQTLRRSAEGATYIRQGITLGIGPHSSYQSSLPTELAVNF